MKKDIQKLKKELEDYYGTAAFSGMPMAMTDLWKVQSSSDEEILKNAQENGFDISEYLSDD